MSGDACQPIEFDGFSDEFSMEVDASADSVHLSYSTHDITFGRDSRTSVVKSQVELVLVTSYREFRSPRFLPLLEIETPIVTSTCRNSTSDHSSFRSVVYLF